MTNRLKGITVAFSTDIREDDAQRIIDAIGMIKGVVAVEPIAAGAEDWINRTQVKNELIGKIMLLLSDNDGDSKRRA